MNSKRFTYTGDSFPGYLSWLVCILGSWMKRYGSLKFAFSLLNGDPRGYFGKYGIIAPFKILNNCLAIEDPEISIMLFFKKKCLLVFY